MNTVSGFRWFFTVAAVAAVFMGGAERVSGAGATAVIEVQANQPGPAISPDLYGIFFEEINCAGDGGLYAELVRNRSFEEPGRTSYWQQVTTGFATGSISADASKPLSARNVWSLKLTQTSGGGSVGAANPGFWGMHLKAGEVYDVSLYARGAEGFTGPVVVRLENRDSSQVLSQVALGPVQAEWTHFKGELVPSATVTDGRLVVALLQPGTVWVDVVSLFPRDTFRGRTNGLRRDLGEMLSELNPAFVRFPGGCWVEGEWMTNAYRWKDTIGPIGDRATKTNLWRYMSNNGLGYHEYLQLCEDLGAAPMFVINCGMAHRDTVPLSEMEEYVQDALDAIEYANGDTNTTWGALRAANGHPAPFNLKYLQIGNENGGSAYDERYALFYDAIKAKYPEIQLIACVWGGTPTSRPLEIIDEHYYNNPAFFANNARRYDTYSRSGPKVYVGEYAVTSGNGNGNLMGALAEAAFMTGLERNSDIVVMASYAPLFANLNHKVWNPDLIYFDNWRVALTPSYHVQKMFARNRGDVVLPVQLSVTEPLETSRVPRGAIGVGSWNTSVEYKDVVVTSNGVTLYQSDFSAGADEWDVYNGTWNTADGVYRQTKLTTDCRATTGSTEWSGYTIRLKARKVSGEEGFLILFNWRNDANWTWWNLGGWNNTRHAIEVCRNDSKSVLGPAVNGSIETGRWYDIRIELSGDNIRCYLDDVLVHDVSYPKERTGAIGLGTWNTAASFTNVVVTEGDTVLYQSDFTSGASEWKVFRGTWNSLDGLYRQTALITDCRSTTGSTNWSDYMIRLKARKDSGSEGFLILFHWKDNDNWTWWNIGGWNNTQHAIEVCKDGSKSILGSAVAGSVVSGVWYDIRIELIGDRIRCFLNDELIHDVRYDSPMPVMVATSSFDEATGQIILKAVNLSEQPVEAKVRIHGRTVAPGAKVIELSSEDPTVENTLESPDNVAPVEFEFNGAGESVDYTFPPYSLTVLRLQTRPVLPPRARIDCDTNQNDLSAYPDGLPVRLSSFITNTVSVDYVLEGADRRVVAAGTLTFEPGDLVQRIEVPESIRRPGTFLRVTLVNPVGLELDAPTHAYFAWPASADEPLRLGLGRFDDEALLYWLDAEAELQASPDVRGPWVGLSNYVSPVMLDFADPIRFFRLERR